MQLTNADRRILLDSFCRLSTDWEGETSDLLKWSTEWVASIAPSFGFELNLSRDVFVLCDVLRKAADEEAVALARGGLAYLYRNRQGDPLTLGALGLLDDAFVAGYAAHAVREKLGDAATFRPPRLSSDEQGRAEAMFVELFNQSDDLDSELPELAELALAKLGHLLESGLFRRLRMNVRYLSRVLADADRSADHQVARAALYYVAAEQDAIPDSLGLIGFLDDYFIADLAVGWIDAGQSPWMNLIDAAVGTWPFLNMASFGDANKAVPASEFLMINIALVCPTLRGQESSYLTHLVLPRTGALPLVLGFFAALGELHSARGRHGKALSFEVGQKVLVDGKAVREFVGCRLEDGRTFLRLRKDRQERGQRNLGTIEELAIEQLHRLTPVSAERTTRGRITDEAFQKAPIGALDYLFLASEPLTIPRDIPQVVVVSPVGRARRGANEIKLFGSSLCDILPIGSRTTTGDNHLWSERFGIRKPNLLVISDLDRACEYIEDQSDKVALTIVDATGPNAGRLASLSRLRGIGARVLVAVSQTDADSVVDDEDSVVWEWAQADFASLYVDPASAATDPMQAYEHGVVRWMSADIQMHEVQSAEVDQAYRSVVALKRFTEARGGDVPQNLEEALSRSFVLLNRLMRCPFTLSDHPRLEADLTAKLNAVAACLNMADFLTEQEVQGIAAVQHSLRVLIETLQRSNAKADALRRIKSVDPDCAIAYGDVDLLDDPNSHVIHIPWSAFDSMDGCKDSGHAVSGWYGKTTMNRLLRPPFAIPLYLILYPPEASWYRAFTNRYRVAASARRARSARGSVFPGVGLWPDASRIEATTTEAETPVSSGGEAPDAIETYLSSERRKRLVAQAGVSNGEELVEARFFEFNGGHAFLTDDYQAKLATHLLADEAQDDSSIDVVPARRLRCGDLLLFIRGSNRDVIRLVADQLLPAGEREHSGLWRTALLDHFDRSDRSVEVLWRGLAEHGCRRNLTTVDGWIRDDAVIAPHDLDAVLRSIIALTGHSGLRAGIESCKESCSKVRGAHLRASHMLAKRVIDQVVAGLKTASSDGGTIDLGEGIILAKITDIDETTLRVRGSVANRLVEGSTWPT